VSRQRARDQAIRLVIDYRAGEGLASSEDLIHDLGSGRDHRPQFPAVHDLGCPGGGVPDQPSDLFDAN
jgi:hypothetical protein